MAAEVPQTLEYRGGQLNVAPVLEVEISPIGKEVHVPHHWMPEVQWTPDERKSVNLDQRLKSLIMSVLPDDQINSVINCLTAKSTWDDLILYHDGPSDVKESRVMDLKLCYNTFKFKEDLRPTKDFEAKNNKAKDKIPSHPSAPTLVVVEMHKEAQQAAGGPTSLGATSEEGAHPQLSSGMSAFINIEPVHSASFTFHSESASGNDVLADSIAKVDPRKSAPNDQTKSARDGLKTAHTDLDLMKDTRSAFFNPDYPTDEPITVTDESEEEKAEKHKEAHSASHNEPEDTSASHPPSPKSIQL
ncbi:hypothetical protein Tco_0308551 [Tanacetum coccineum]